MQAKVSDALWKEYNLARKSFYQAQTNFDNAIGEYIDVAISELNAAEQKMDALLREIKREQGVAV